MAVSSTTDFSLTAVDVINETRQILGIHADEEPLEAHELQKGLKSLNIMLKAWQGDAEISWPLTEGSLTLVKGQASYSFATGGDFTTVPFSMVDMRITRSGTDLQMFRINRETYFQLPLKTNEGHPTQWYYDRQRDTGTLYVWPSSDAALGTLKFTYRRRILDIDVQTNNLDLPQEWYDAIIWNLAERLLTAYPVSPERRSLILAKAEKSLALIRRFDVGTDEGSISIIPAWGGNYA